MYLLITLVHLLFIYSVYSLGFYILAGIFTFLFAYFILYFSPVFFTKEKIDIPSFSWKNFSLKDSLIFPMWFFYLALVIFLFWLLRDFHITTTVTLYTFALWFVVFLGYMMLFDWKNDLFFDITRIHFVLSLSIVWLVTVLSFFQTTDYSLENSSLLIGSIVFWYFFFRTSRKESPFLFQIYLIGVMLSIYNSVLLFSEIQWIPFFLTLITLTSIGIFELIPRLSYFSQYTIASRILSLGIILVSLVWHLIYALWDYTYVGVIILSLFFLLSVHIRFSNYVAFILAIIGVFFLYGNTFFSLLSPMSLGSSLIYIFFLSFCIVGSTYFWEEKYQYDFSVLHYASALFSTLLFLFATFFLAWGESFFFLISGWIFSLGTLLLLSYFRFRYK